MAKKHKLPIAQPMRLCWWCKFFTYSAAEPDYSELTPGCAFDVVCMKGHWDFRPYDTTQKEFATMIQSAESCSDFIEEVPDGK